MSRGIDNFIQWSHSFHIYLHLTKLRSLSYEEKSIILKLNKLVCSLSFFFNSFWHRLELKLQESKCSCLISKWQIPLKLYLATYTSLELDIFQALNKNRRKVAWAYYDLKHYLSE